LCVLPEEELLLPSEYIIREKISFWYSVPTLASFMDKFGALKEGVFPTLRYSLFCGEPLPMELALKWMEAAPNSTVENLYGPTEATIHLTRRSLNNEDNGKTYNNGIVPIGLPYPDHTVEIVDDKGTRVKRGETGEITYKGPQITKGYLNDSEKTKDVFIQYEWDETREIWYKSGDLGFFNNDGDLECLGRKDNQIKIAGRRVEIGEIESIIRENTKLKDAVIVPVRNGDSTVKSLVAFTMVKISEGERAHLDEANDLPLEKIFRPSRIVYVENFPLLESGKTNRKKLEAMAKAG
jgi:D-alanine--poly(phosphoribitol) ligase subunit 1